MKHWDSGRGIRAWKAKRTEKEKFSDSEHGGRPTALLGVSEYRYGGTPGAKNVKRERRPKEDPTNGEAQMVQNAYDNRADGIQGQESPKTRKAEDTNSSDGIGSDETNKAEREQRE